MKFLRDKYTYDRTVIVELADSDLYEILPDGTIFSHNSRRVLPDSRYFPDEESFVAKAFGNRVLKRVDVLAYLKWGEEVIIDPKWIFYIKDEDDWNPDYYSVENVGRSAKTW